MMAPPTVPPLSTIILAAGGGRRMGGRKMERLFRGRPLLAHAVETALSGPATPVLVVEGGRDLGPVLHGLPVTRVANPDWALGLSTSLKAGLDALPSDCGAVLVMLGDMPAVDVADLEGLVTVFRRHGGRRIVAAINGQTLSPPAIFPESAFAEMRLTTGDQGARALLRKKGVVALPLPADHLRDVDRPADLDPDTDPDRQDRAG